MKWKTENQDISYLIHPLKSCFFSFFEPPGYLKKPNFKSVVSRPVVYIIKILAFY